jgi:VWFA-related protein
MDEFRTVPASGERAAPNGRDVLVLRHFESLLNYFSPQSRGDSDFRYAGHLNAGGHDLAVVAFAQHSDSRVRSHVTIDEGGRTTRIHGLAWIDTASGMILRLHVEMAEQAVNFPFDLLNTDVVFIPVAFRAVESELWLPLRATVHARFAGGEVHTIHRFSDFRMWGERADAPHEAGTTTAAADTSEDAFEALARGIQLANDHKLDEAVAALRESVRREPESALARFHLAVALNSTGDPKGAERELREGLKRQPDNGPAHNFLAIVLSKQGDLKSAADEFRSSARLQPKNAVAHFNLGQALEKLGKIPDAIAAYRDASALEPNNSEYRTRLEHLERSPGAGGEATIRVEVRQVLAPVIVTDRDGHHVIGLKPADFHISEDGIEQKITSFSSESAGAERLPESGIDSTTTHDATTERNRIRRTYVICLDALHTSIANLVNVRTSLEQLFRAERPGDAQYVRAAAGRTTEILQNTTSDPARVIGALDERSFQKRLLDSRRAATEFDLSRFRRLLDEAKRLCDSGDPACASRKRALPIEADQITVEDRVSNRSFLGQLHSLVEQLSHGNDRRTLVLISAGFGLVPGKEAHELLRAYFPEFRFAALGTVDRMQDEFEQLVRLASKNNITIHTVDARGLYAQSYFEASSTVRAAAAMPAVLNAMNQSASDSRAALAEIAAATGGIAFQNSNDLLGGLARAFADGREYYLLGYVSSNSNMDGTFRTIAVRVRDRSLVVRAKRGYWATEN